MQKQNNLNRRSFIKNSALAGGGLLISFSWLAGCVDAGDEQAALPENWYPLNNYIKIGNNGMVTLQSANPEFGSNVKTSMPMILAEELDVDWKDVRVEQADFYPERFDRQFTGGSQGIRQGWKPLRTAGATARQLLVLAAAAEWKVPAAEITTKAGVLYHAASGKKAGYGELAAKAATLPVPENPPMKSPSDFSIIGQSKANVDGKKIVTGAALYSLDHYEQGMLTAMVEHPPAFGQKVKKLDDQAARAMPGITDVFVLQTLGDDYERNGFDTTSFPEMVVVVGHSTWEVLQAKKALKVEWEQRPDALHTVNGWGGKQQVKYPGAPESSAQHRQLMTAMAARPAKVLRKDGDPEAAFKRAAKIIERTYYAPYLAHNTMEPVNCYAHVTADKADIYGPIQAPEFIITTLATRLGLPKEKIQIRLARMGGGFGLRAYGHHLVEAALVSQRVKAPVKLVYTREDDMSYGIYRPTYTATYRAALDAQNNLTAFTVKGGGIPEHAVHANRFPAGAVDNYQAEGWQLDSNITIGAFRAPRSNFIAGAEQSFLDEVAEAAGKDPIAFRLELLERARVNPVGKDNDYDAARYAGVLELVREKSGWGAGSAGAAGVSGSAGSSGSAGQNNGTGTGSGRGRGVAAYFCHNTYVAEVLELEMKGGQPVVNKVVAAVDCGIVVNPDAARNMGEGGIVDGIGNALYGELEFDKGVPTKKNFDSYRMIRFREAPKQVEVHFVESKEDPTGLGEPLFPPVFAAVANALYQATGRRLYEQPFGKQLQEGQPLG